MLRGLALAIPMLFWAPAQADLAFNGRLGTEAALLMIDGQPRTVRLGQTVQGIRLVSLEGESAVVEVDGARRTLLLGAAPASVNGTGAPKGRQIVLSSGLGGHFTTSGAINGRATQFMVDTGATAVAISQQEAENLGLKYREGRSLSVQTANGPAPGYLITLAVVRIGDVEVRNVEAVVVPSQMSHVLLGNSFLSRFQMHRDNDILTLDLRY